jgi:signal transduction histidine kinase
MHLPKQLTISLSHLQKDLKSDPLFAGGQVPTAAVDTRRQQFKFGDQQLLAEATLLHHYFPFVYRLLPWMLLAAGISLGAMLAFYVSRIQRENQRVAELVARGTQELRQEKERNHLLAEQAQRASRAKSEYLAGMSHEIRTPMNAIIGFAEIMAEESLSHVHRQYIGTIHDSARTLVTLIDDILDLAKIEVGCLEIRRVECALCDLLGHVDVLLRPNAHCKELDFQIKVCPDMPQLIWTDPARMRQCLINLIGNAIRYTDAGHVYVTVSSQWQNDKLWMRVDVEDTGIGIDPDRLQTIFEAFAQPGECTNRPAGATGLGLSITRSLAELMGGTLTVQSVPMKGSVFTLVVPADPAEVMSAVGVGV